MKKFKEINPDDAAFAINCATQGLTKRELFANSAPDVPEWFRHTAPPQNYPVAPSLSQIDNAEDAAIVEEWMEDACYDLPEHLMWFQDQYTTYWVAYYKAELKWEYENKVSCFFQWRTYYAENLINQLNK